MTGRITSDHPAMILLRDALAATRGPGTAEDIAGLLTHALDATGFTLTPKGEAPLFDKQFVGANLVLACARTGCAATEVVSINDAGGPGEAVSMHLVSQIMEDDWPTGWGWDAHGGLDYALHCPDHRDPVEAPDAQG